ncbi:MAG: cupin domain-containing protein [Candidatus Bathyarchaeia archaeon]
MKNVFQQRFGWPVHVWRWPSRRQLLNGLQTHKPVHVYAPPVRFGDWKLIVSNWSRSGTVLSHGGLLAREILSRAEPSGALKPAAVMQHAKSFSRAVLQPSRSTPPVGHEAEQEVLYVVEGEGALEAGDKTWPLREGSALLIPAGVSHTLRNMGDFPLELLVLTEALPPGYEKRATSVLARNRHEVPIVLAHWNMQVAVLFSDTDGLAALHSVLAVVVDPMQVTEPHGHPVGTDEVWYLLEGAGLHMVGQELTEQWPGDAVYIREEPHVIINDSDEPITMFYFAHYGGR